MLFARLTLIPLPLQHSQISLYTRASSNHPPSPITVFNKYHHLRPTPNHSINHPKIVVSITLKDPSPSKKKKKRKREERMEKREGEEKKKEKEKETRKTKKRDYRAAYEND